MKSNRHALSTFLTLGCIMVASWLLVLKAAPKFIDSSSRAEAASKSYTTSWKATRLLQLQYGRSYRQCTEYSQGWWNSCIRWTDSISYSATAPSGHIATQDHGGEDWYVNGETLNLGVAEWEVKGQVPTSNTFYKETWSIPGGRNLEAKIETKRANSNSPYLRSMTFSPASVNDSMFSIGLADLSYAIRFYTVDAPSTGSAVRGNPNLDVEFGNGAANCRWEVDVNCLASTGAYGWSDENAIDFNRGTRGNNGMGTFMPLRWDVQGYICDSASEVRCQ